MPLIQVWLRKGTTPQHRKGISNSIHRAMVDVLGIPEDDYFQVTHELDAEDMLFDPNYFGLPRSERFIMIRLSFNARPAAMKQKLFETIAANLVKDPGLDKADMGMSIVETTFENWWAHGRLVDPATGTDSRMSA
jgi:4-oxalocrotonate tautomerase